MRDLASAPRDATTPPHRRSSPVPGGPQGTLCRHALAASATWLAQRPCPISMRPAPRDRLRPARRYSSAAPPRGLEPEREFALHMIGDRARNGDATRFSKLLEPRRNDDALAVPILPIDDHVAQIDPHAHVNALAASEVAIPFAHAA